MVLPFKTSGTHQITEPALRPFCPEGNCRRFEKYSASLHVVKSCVCRKLSPSSSWSVPAVTSVSAGLI